MKDFIQILFAGVLGSAAVAKNRAEMTGGAIVPEMEHGSIHSNSGSYLNTKNYIRTKNGYTIWLNSGAVIGLSDYSGAGFHLRYTLPDGTFKAKDNLTSDYTVQKPGFYRMVVFYKPLREIRDEEIDALKALVNVTNTAFTYNYIN